MKWYIPVVITYIHKWTCTYLYIYKTLIIFEKMSFYRYINVLKPFKWDIHVVNKFSGSIFVPSQCNSPDDGSKMLTKNLETTSYIIFKRLNVYNDNFIFFIMNLESSNIYCHIIFILLSASTTPWESWSRTSILNF